MVLQICLHHSKNILKLSFCLYLAEDELALQIFSQYPLLISSIIGTNLSSGIFEAFSTNLLNIPGLLEKPPPSLGLIPSMKSS